MPKRILAVVVTVGAVSLLTAAMLPFRTHLSVATCGLLLVVPVVIGAALGGLPVGVAAVAAGFLAYDFFFVPPYGTLSVGTAQDWAALVVYVIVMLVVARVVALLQDSRAAARRREDDTRRLYLLSDQLIGEHPLDDLLRLVANTIAQAFHCRWVAVLLPAGGALTVAATAGGPLPEEDSARLSPAPGRLESLRTDEIVRVALTALGRPVGMVALSGVRPGHDAELLRTYANQAALAIERSQLRHQALRTELLEEVDRWRDALMSAVSHDLRTPLASMKAAVSTLRRSDCPVSDDDREELLAMIEAQTDTLNRLVTDLLDMTRIRAGALELRREVVPVAELVDEAVHVVQSGQLPLDVRTEIPADLPPVDVDQVLMVQVLANLLENAARYSPDGRPVEVAANAHNGTVSVAVRDHGPGVPVGERERVFEMFNRAGGGGGRAGLGLTIAKAFVEAHGEHISVGAVAGGGAAFTFTMQRADAGPDARD